MTNLSPKNIFLIVSPRFFVLTFVLISAFWCLFSLNGCMKKEKKPASEIQEAIPVRVAKIELRNIQKTLDYVGNIKAQDEVMVYPRVNGKIIEKVVEEGKSISKGDVIVYIDRDEVGFKFEKAPVESPLSGIIGRIYVDKGTSVTPQVPVALVVDMDKVKVSLDIPEQYLPKVVIGQSAQIILEAYPGEKFIGTVTKISPILDLETRTVPIEIVVSNNDHRLKSGMFAKVSLVIQESKGAPVILKEAVTGREPELYAYVIENKKAVLRKISLGIRQGPYYEVTEGLREGEQVVIVGQQRLYENALVIVEDDNGQGGGN